MQIALSGFMGKQVPALHCFQCEGTLTLQGFHTLHLISSPFYYPIHALPRKASAALVHPVGIRPCRSSSLHTDMAPGLRTAMRQQGQAQASQQQCRGCLSPAPQATSRPGAARPAAQLSPAAVPTDSSSAAWRP